MYLIVLEFLVTKTLGIGEIILLDKIEDFLSARRDGKKRKEVYDTAFEEAFRSKLSQADRHMEGAKKFCSLTRVRELMLGYYSWLSTGTKSEMLTRYISDGDPTEERVQDIFAGWYVEENETAKGEALSIIEALLYADSQATRALLSSDNQIMLRELEAAIRKAETSLAVESQKQTSLLSEIAESITEELGKIDLVGMLEYLIQAINKPLQDFERREKKDNYLLYDANRIRFCGREKEMGQLIRFCEDEQNRVRWCQIIGEGGCGKSRLAYEFKYEMGRRGWTVYWLTSADDIERFLVFPEQDTLVIADYAQTYCAPLVNNLLRSAENNNPAHKLRVILMDRQEITFPGGADASDMHDTASDILLPVLTDEALLAIMDELARVKGNPLKLSEQQELLDRLKEIDPDLCRPLYALMLTAIACEGAMDEVRNVSAEGVLDYVLKHNFDIMRSNLSSFYQRKASTPVPEGALEDDLSFLRELQTIATVNGDISLRDLEILYPNEWQDLQAILATVRSRRGQNMLNLLLTSVGMLDGDQIPAVRPDILGERLVWKRYIQNCDSVDWMFPDGYVSRGENLEFLRRFISNYGRYISEGRIFWIFAGKIEECNDSHFFAPTFFTHQFFWRKLFIQHLNIQYLNEGIAAVEKLKIEWEKCPQNLAIAEEYVRKLSDLTFWQDLNRCIETVKKLDMVWKCHPQESAIAEEYANGLCNLTAKQNLPECIATVKELKKVWESNSRESEIAEKYAKVLVNMTEEQDLDGCIATVEELKKVWECHSQEFAIAEKYAEGLYNLTVKQNLIGRIATVEELKKVWEHHPQEYKIAEGYARVLVNMTVEQDLDGCIATVEELKKVWEHYPQESSIAEIYDRGLVRLMSQQDLPECTVTVQKIKQLQKKFPSETFFAICYVRGQLALLVAYMREPQLYGDLFANDLKELYSTIDSFQQIEYMEKIKSKADNLAQEFAMKKRSCTNEES